MRGDWQYSDFDYITPPFIQRRRCSKDEDGIYSLVGIFGVILETRTYDEGLARAFERFVRAIVAQFGRDQDADEHDRSGSAELRFRLGSNWKKKNDAFPCASCFALRMLTATLAP